jgi:hypothetical protein
MMCHRRDYSALTVLIVCLGFGAPTRQAMTSDWPPRFQDLEGRELRPLDDPSVKAVVLIFVLPDCPIGNSYLPEIRRLNDSFDSRGVVMLLVHADSEVTAQRAREHAHEYSVKIPVVLDPQHVWVKRSEATVAPEAAVFSRGGELLYRGRIDNQYAGLGKRRAVVTEHDLKNALESIVNGKKVQQSRTEAVGCLIPDPSSGK